MAKTQRPIISDPNIEVPGTTMEERLKKYDQEKAEYSRIREEEWIEKKDIIDSFLNGIDKIKKLFSRKKVQDIAKAATLDNQKQK